MALRGEKISFSKNVPVFSLLFYALSTGNLYSAICLRIINTIQSFALNWPTGGPNTVIMVIIPAMLECLSLRESLSLFALLSLSLRMFSDTFFPSSI